VTGKVEGYDRFLGGTSNQERIPQSVEGGKDGKASSKRGKKEGGLHAIKQVGKPKIADTTE